MSGSFARLGFVGLFGLAACGGSPPVAEAPSAPPPPPPTGEAPPVPSERPAAAPTTPRDTTPAGRLQGTWEITRYTSTQRIPEEAMPLMGKLFDVLRLRFDGASLVVTAGTVKESSPFSVEPGGRGKAGLVLRGGMFDGAALRFVDDEHVELVVDGKAWPGVSVLTRTAP